MLTAFFARLIIVVFGVMHPSYRTYKAIKRRDYQEVVTLGMYWVVFSTYITIELLTDTFLQWLPFYYEAKTLFVIWLVTPATSGYSYMYRKVIHPELSKRENKIDEAIIKAKETGYNKVVEFSAKGLNYAAKTVVNTALLGQDFLTDHLLRRSSSMFELNKSGISTRELIKRRMDAGDISCGSPDYTDQDFSRNLHADDPFALSWLHPESTGSLGRHWKTSHKGLSGVLEDNESTTGEHINHPVTRSNTTKRTNVAQNYLKMIDRDNPHRSSLPNSPLITASRDFAVSGSHLSSPSSTRTVYPPKPPRRVQ